MKIGVIGFSSYFRRVYLPYLKMRKDVQLLAVCDILSSEALTGLIADNGLSPYPALFSDVHKMLKASDLDAVIISTPHIFHFEQARDCLQAGLHVFLDKPLACRFKDAQTLVKIAHDKGLRLAVGSQRRYERPYEYVKEAISKGRLGEIRVVNYLFSNSPWYDYRKSWRGDSALSGGGVLMDIGYLAVDMVVWLLERRLKRVYAVAPTPEALYTEHSVAIIAEFEPYILVNLMITYEAPIPSVQEELSIYGSNSSIFARRFQPRRSNTPPFIVEQSRKNEIQRIDFTDVPDSSKSLDDFLYGVKTGCSIRSDGKSNLPTLELIEYAYNSIQEKLEINIPISNI